MNFMVVWVILNLFGASRKGHVFHGLVVNMSTVIVVFCVKLTICFVIHHKVISIFAN